MQPDREPDIREIMRTPDERALLRLTALGQTPAQAARALAITLPEAEAALKRLQTRCGVSSRRALVVHAIIWGWP